MMNFLKKLPLTGSALACSGLSVQSSFILYREGDMAEDSRALCFDEVLVPVSRDVWDTTYAVVYAYVLPRFVDDMNPRFPDESA